MTAPTLSLTQNIVRVGMAELLSGGKVISNIRIILYCSNNIIGSSSLSCWLW